MKYSSSVTFRLREILLNISEGNHDEDLCKENCELNRKLFNHAHFCQYSQFNFKSFMNPSRSDLIKALLCKKPLGLDTSDISSPPQSLWDRNKVEDQELVKFDLKVTQFKAMEIEVQEGRRALEDLEQLRIEMDEL